MNRRLAAAISSSILVLIVAAGASFAASSFVITGTRTIDGYRVGTGYAQARQLLGGPISATQDHFTCTARWTSGVTISWRRTLPSLKWEKACVKFSWAKATGKSWRTDKGLRVGATTSALQKAYAGAKSKQSSGYAVWTLVSGPSVSLQAWVKNGRIAYFRIAGK